MLFLNTKFTILLTRQVIALAQTNAKQHIILEG
jgi:hypothetical protein